MVSPVGYSKNPRKWYELLWVDLRCGLSSFAHITPLGIKRHASWLYKYFADFPISYEVWFGGNEGGGDVV